MDGFIIIGNTNAVTYKEVFPLFKDGKVRFGYSKRGMDFNSPDGLKNINAVWYSTFPVTRKPLILTQKYDPDKYPVYDNYPAINVDRIKNIPYDYDGVMGVPITILNYDLENVEIVGLAADKRYDDKIFIKGEQTYLNKKNKKFVGMVLNGKATYARVLVKKKFEIVGIAAESGSGDCSIRGKETYVDDKHKRSTCLVLNGKRCYAKVIVRRKTND